MRMRQQGFNFTIWRELIDCIGFVGTPSAKVLAICGYH